MSVCQRHTQLRKWLSESNAALSNKDLVKKQHRKLPKAFFQETQESISTDQSIQS